MGPLADLEPFGLGGLREAAPAPAEVFGQLFAFHRDAGVKIERVVLDLDVVFVLELVDPSLADVAPWSNEVAKHVQRNSHDRSSNSSFVILERSEESVPRNQKTDPSAAASG